MPQIVQHFLDGCRRLVIVLYRDGQKKSGPRLRKLAPRGQRKLGGGITQPSARLLYHTRAGSIPTPWNREPFLFLPFFAMESRKRLFFFKRVDYVPISNQFRFPDFWGDPALDHTCMSKCDLGSKVMGMGQMVTEGNVRASLPFVSAVEAIWVPIQ